MDTVLLRRLRPDRHRVPHPAAFHLAGITAHPDGLWTTQAARNLLMDPGQRVTSIKFLIRDRAGQFTRSAGAVFTAEGTTIPASPPQAPTANAICEQRTGTLRRELSGRCWPSMSTTCAGYRLNTCCTATPPGHTMPPGQLAPAHAGTRPPQITLAEHQIHRKQILGGLTHEYQTTA